jgi:putative phosphoesterase
MIRIGVLADTHLPDNREATAFLQALAARHFADTAMILHAGDVVAPGVLEALAPCPVYGVRGNMDPVMPGFPYKRVLEIDGVRIGLIHGWGPPAGLAGRVRAEFADTPLDCLVFGHSHVPLCQREGALLLFNPGSATDRRGQPSTSVGILEVAGGAIAGRIVWLDG